MNKLRWDRWKPLLIRYGTAVVVTILATLVRKALNPFLENTAPFSAYYAAVMIAAWFGGLGPALVAMLAGAILADFLFIEPHLSLLASNLEHQVGLGLYIVVGLIVAALSESLHASRRKIDAARAELAEAIRELQKEIAERQQAERWLLESEQRFRGYFEQGLVGMIMLTADRVLIEVNQRACQMLGYSEADLSGKKWTDFVHPDDLSRDESQFRRLRDGLIQGYVSDQRFVRKDGKTLCTSLSVQCMRKADGTVDCVLVLAQDLSRRNRADEAIRPVQEQFLVPQREPIGQRDTAMPVPACSPQEPGTLPT